MTGQTARTDDLASQTLKHALRVKSFFLTFIALLVAAIAFIVLILVRNIAVEQQIALSRLSAAFFQYPILIVLASLPAVAAALVGVFTRRSAWLWITLTTVLLLLPVAIAIHCFIQVVGSMYQYQQL